MRSKTILLYCSGIDDVLGGSSKVAGIQVQMSLWAEKFIREGWHVYALSTNNFMLTISSIHFISIRNHKLIGTIEEWIKAFYLVCKLSPRIVMVRGVRRDLYPLTIACRIKRAKLVFMGASDVNFQPGKDWMGGVRLSTYLYRLGLKEIDYFITQNQVQKDSLKVNYNKDSIIIPNVWTCEKRNEKDAIKYDVIWVANFRKLKRPEWYVELAKRMPQFKFLVIGGPASDVGYYEQMKSETEKVGNIVWKGVQSFNDTNAFFGESRVLLCTSEYEGFPNTFLQAWSNAIPVVSSVDPNELLSKKGLGVFSTDIDGIEQGIRNFLNKKELYNKATDNISQYFYENHSINIAYDKMMKYIIE